MIKDLLKDIVRSLLSVYHQTKLVQFYKKRGVEIHKPFYPFDSNCLIITPPRLYRTRFVAYFKRETVY